MSPWIYRMLHELSCRSAAKARRKDPSGLAQKIHFSKLRHRILSRGVFPVDNDAEPKNQFMSRMDLAHAQMDIQSKHRPPNRSDERTRVEVSSDSFPSNKRSLAKKQPNMDKEMKDKIASSKVLAAVDLNDRE